MKNREMKGMCFKSLFLFLAFGSFTLSSFGAPDNYLLSAVNLSALEGVRQVFQESSVVIEDEKQRSIGYGVIVSEEGLILTKASLIQELEGFHVRHGRRQLTAEILKTSREWDVALLRIKGQEVKPVVFSDVVPVAGMMVVSNGVTSIMKRRHKFGLISANSREVLPKVATMDFLATYRDQKGFEVLELVPGGAAEMAGLLAGDLIISLDGEDITQKEVSFSKYYIGKWPDELAQLTLLRGEQSISLAIPYQWRYKVFPNPMDRNEAMSGRISARRTGFPEVIQHDIALSARSIGGPLLNLEGQCVGMNIARFSRAETYALPASALMQLLDAWGEE